MKEYFWDSNVLRFFSDNPDNSALRRHIERVSWDNIFLPCVVVAESWNDDRLFIDPTWNSVSGNRHGELNAVGAAEVSVSHFVGQWTIVLEKIYEAVLMSGVTLEDRENFDALGSLLGQARKSVLNLIIGTTACSRICPCHA